MNHNLYEEEFLDDTLMEAGFDPQEDDFELLKEDLRPILTERIMIQIFSQLDKEYQDRLGVLLEEENMEEITSLLQDQIPELDEMIGKLLQDFQDEYVEAMKEE